LAHRPGASAAEASAERPCDETLTGLSRLGLHAIHPHVLAFVAHDRISLTGATAAHGVLFAYLSWFGLRRGDHWARPVFLVGCGAGFLTFFLFLGYGYFDPRHLLACLVLLPFYLLALAKHRSVETAVSTSLHNDRDWRIGQ